MQNTDPVSLTYGQLTDFVERVEQIPTLSGAGAPTASTPAFYKGQMYLDTTNNEVYVCTALPTSGAAPYTWKKTDTTYTAGANVQISGTTISATDTTYSDFVGTDGTTAGTAGLVPAPATTDAGKILKADGTWHTAGAILTAGDGIDITNDVISATNTGKAKMLTTDDYNYPVDNPAYVALWLLEPGVYWRASANVEVRWKTATAGKTDVSNTNIFIIGGDITTSHPMMAIGSSVVKTTVLSADGGSTADYPKTYIKNDSIVDDLTSTSTIAPLSANQGKVLKDLVDSIAIRGTGAPTTSTAGQVGTLYEDTTNGDLYICTDATNPYVWEEVGAGGGSNITVLTSADYDYPDNNPTAVAAWRLSPGMYTNFDGTNIAEVRTTTSIGLSTFSGTTFVIGEHSDAGNSARIPFVNLTAKRIGYITANGSSVGLDTIPAVVQSTGTSTTDVMSQNAVTNMVFADPSQCTKVLIGGSSVGTSVNPVAIGQGAGVRGDYAIAIGGSAGGQVTSTPGGVSLGAFSSSAGQGQMSIGLDRANSIARADYGYNGSAYRLLTGLYDGQSDHDAATVAQGNKLMTAAPTTTDAGVLGQLWTDTTNMHTYQLTAIDNTTDPQNPTYTWTQRW